MMRQGLVLAAVAVVSLAGCGSREDMSGNSGGATTAIEPTSTNLTDDPGNTAVPLTATPTPIAVPAIPAAFRGRWGMTANDCDPARDDNKGLMTVTADRLTFYESRALPRDLRLAGTTLTGTLDFSGEGQRWQAPAHLVLSDGGRTLLRDTTDEGVVRYSRCP